MSNELLFVGSLPCQTAEETFRTFGTEFGPYLAYLPDGEVGDRSYWNTFVAYKVLNGHPEIDLVRRPAPHADGVENWKPRSRHDQFQFRVKPGVDKVRFGDPGWRLGYARDALNSYALFKLLKQQNILAKHLRFQVCIPLTYSLTHYYFPPEDEPKIVPGLNGALRDEVKKLVELIPANELAIQWDAVAEQKLIEAELAANNIESAKKTALQVMEPAQEVCSVIPRDAALGYHTCFGTLDGWPSRSPQSLMGPVLLANAAIECSGRPIDFFHIPTLGTASDEFFSPLSDLKANGARIYMGAIHHLHGPGGMSAQLRTIKKYLPEFGLGGACGFGRVPDHPGKIISEDGRVIPDYIETIQRDHKAALAELAKVAK
jgi:hypothetical protein